MVDVPIEDLLSLDRAVARGAAAWTEWRVALDRNPEAHASDQPLEAVRHVAGLSTWRALGERTPSAASVPLRDALRRWVVALTLARIGQADDVACARAASERTGHFAGDPPRILSWSQAWRGVVAAGSAPEARLWLHAAADAAPPLAEANAARTERRIEVARRFGFDHPWQALVGVPPAPLLASARRLLDATDDIARASMTEALGRHSSSGGWDLAAVVQMALAREAGDGWPAHLSVRWLNEIFKPSPSDGRVEGALLPPVHGAASFMRALFAFGRAAHGSVAPIVPFALARDPAGAGALRFAFAFASLATDAHWQWRALGVGRRTALAQARVLARTALIDARLQSARILLCGEKRALPRQELEGLSARVFGSCVDAKLCGAWPGERPGEPARFVALLEALAFTQSLRERYDVDWFRNPHAWTHLREIATGPAHVHTDASALPALADRLGRAFEEALG